MSVDSLSPVQSTFTIVMGPWTVRPYKSPKGEKRLDVWGTSLCEIKVKSYICTTARAVQ